MKSFWLSLCVAALMVIPANLVLASEAHHEATAEAAHGHDSHAAGPGITGDEALKKMVEGNARFMNDDKSYTNWGAARRAELTGGQKPFAIVLGCSDSRVPPEHVFDQELGDIFVVRVAGNVVDSDEIASIEYAVAHLGTPLIIVLGHQSCGAVKAAIDGAKDTEYIINLVKKIDPSVKKAQAVAKDKAALLDAAIIENARNSAESLTKNSKVLKEKIDKGEVKLTAGVYNLATGKVDLIDLHN